MDELGRAIKDVTDEVVAAMAKYPAMNSAHEGWAVIWEELDELWDEVKVKQGHRNAEKLYQEAKQTAAMAIRFMLDIANGRSQA